MAEGEESIVSSTEHGNKEAFTRLFYDGCIDEWLFLMFIGPVDREEDEK